MASVANKVGIVTGGGTGIGRASALAMAKAGASLVIGNRNAKLGEEVVWALEQAGGRAVFQVTDVSKPYDARTLVERSLAGRIGSKLNPAGTTSTATKPPTKSTSGCRRLCSATNETLSHLPDAASRCHPAPCGQREVTD
jgi:NAD(P)-dependent dehydrogenase (short-subunit alcohol dehydrogenase family)